MKIMIIILLLLISIGTVSATDFKNDQVSDSIELNQNDENNNIKINSDFSKTPQNNNIENEEKSFTDLSNEIKSAEDSLNLTENYKFNNNTDKDTGIVISKDNFVLDGKGFTIDGNNKSRIFKITGNNIVIKNLIMKGGYCETAAGIYCSGNLTLNNISFINNYANTRAGAIGLINNNTLNCNNCQFIDNYAKTASSIYVRDSHLNITHSNISSKMFNKWSQIYCEDNSTIYAEDIIFTNCSSTYAPAFYFKTSNSKIINSRFINLKGNITCGAIGNIGAGNLYIKNCEFINTSSSKNGGAIYIDSSNVIILDSIFNNATSRIGGALVQLTGNISLNNSQFINNHAIYSGGAFYLSFIEKGEINNCTFNLNSVDFIEDYPTLGGAAFFDMCHIIVNKSNFTNNYAFTGSGIYAYDTNYTITNSYFENNTNPIYTVFDGKKCILENNEYMNDNNVSTNNTYFNTIVTGEGIKFTLNNNTINITNLPAKFDLRDWGWVSPVENQGALGSCWAFGMTEALESALLKSTDILFNLSQDNMHNLMLRYSIYGTRSKIGGSNYLSTSYLLNWHGSIPEELDIYDEMGKLSPIFTDNNIHIQDIIFVSNNEIPNGTALKLAILQYGSLDISYDGVAIYSTEHPYYNPDTHAQYINETRATDHEISVIGWDDNYPKENFKITPPGDGAWILKNTWGTDWGDNGYLYLSYYDKTFLPYDGKLSIINSATGIIIENTVAYNKNYQYDMYWRGGFESNTGNISYYNLYEALEDDLIAGVGTYFNESGVNYKIQIYVNDKLKLTQEGKSPFVGFHTIKLNDYIPIKKGDIFKAVVTTNAMPFIDFDHTRVHYKENLSFVSLNDGKTWKDCFNLDKVACLKIYTVADNTKVIDNKNIAVDYDGGSYFSVKVVTDDGHNVGAGEKVKFTINKKSTTVTTDSKGIAKLKIVDLPGKYTITTTYKGTSVKNTVTVKQVLTTNKVTVKRNAKTFYLHAKLKINGKFVKSKVISFKLNGKTYKTKTNSKGIAKVTVKNTFKKGKTYKFTVTYLKDTINSTVKISR